MVSVSVNSNPNLKTNHSVSVLSRFPLFGSTPQGVPGNTCKRTQSLPGFSDISWNACLLQDLFAWARCRMKCADFLFFTVVFLLSFLLASGLKECKKVDACKCSTDKGMIDLWNLAGKHGQPRYV